MGRGEEARGRTRPSFKTLADAFEALIGALPSRWTVWKRERRNLLSRLGEKRAWRSWRTKQVDINPKGNLQELLQSISPQQPGFYEGALQRGPEQRQAICRCRRFWEGIGLGKGRGRSTAKKQADETRDCGGEEEAMEICSAGKKRSASDRPGRRSQIDKKKTTKRS